jgi:hypothetical protein
VVSGMLTPLTADAAVSRRIATVTVAFLEGVALFSVILDEDPIDFQAALNGFQKNIAAVVQQR